MVRKALVEEVGRVTQFDHGDECIERVAHRPDHPEVDRVAASEVGTVDVDLDHLRPGRIELPPEVAA